MIPFPGMDPYLEAPDLWPSFHGAFADQLQILLNASLPAPYYARLEARSEVGIVWMGGGACRIVPDVAIMRLPPPRPQVREAATVYAPAPMLEPRTVASPSIELKIGDEPIRHPFIEIRDAAYHHKLITLIEIVSPSNKRPGPDRDAYLRKQRDVLESDANLVEIDLLREGERLLPFAELEVAVKQAECAYLVVVNRSASRQSAYQDYALYPIGQRDTLPCIAVALSNGVADVLLDVQVAFEHTYRGGPYRRMIDYTLPPDPPLNDDDMRWAEALLREAGLRAAPAP